MHKAHRFGMELGNTPRCRGQNLINSYAHNYYTVLNRALAPSGETAEYFAKMRVQWLHKSLQRLGLALPSSVLDYGCGLGGSVPFLKEILHPEHILGVDIDPDSLFQASRNHSRTGVEFANCEHHLAHSEFHLAFCNGVFHHIEPAQRPAALRYINDSLVPGGLFAFWENNPWNPATRYLMGRCEFDCEAVPISLREAEKLLCSNGFHVMDSSTYFYFPRWLKGLRGLEPALSQLPLGAQYLVLARKTG